MAMPNPKRVFSILITVAMLLAPGNAGWAADDDTALFSVAVPPNVLLMVDNSGSMNHAVWHPSFDKAATPTCTAFTNDATYYYSGDIPSITRCSKTIALYFDPGTSPYSNRIDGRYLNWLFSPESDAYNSDIESNNNGTISSCLGGGTFSKYRRTRITASKHILRDVICQVNAAGNVRFGLATFRVASDPHGGYVRIPINDYLDDDGDPNIYTLNSVSQSHGDHLDDTIEAIDANTWTPLGETLFQVYTYFMDRSSSDRPFGKDGVTRFPEYEYKTTTSGVGGSFSSSGTPTVPDSPVQYACQKNFIVIITDGEPTRDDFDTSIASEDKGFSDFKAKLIGDYNLDGEDEEPGSFPGCTNCEAARYLDDIAKFMQEIDFLPDMDGEQVIDTYTVGFTTSAWANAVLQKTADMGGGPEQFFFSNNAEELSTSIVAAITDIIQKSQSFTAATVPATRTSSGGNLYTSLFVPSDKTPYWEGHLSAFEITAGGELRDANGDCIVDDPTGDCFSGPIVPTAVPYWDAGEEVPPPNSRRNQLYTTVAGVRTDFDTNLTAADLGVTYPPPVPYAGSTATDAEELTDEIVRAAHGCVFGTGVGATACTPRSWLLGDIFHSNPVVIGSPSGFTNESTYLTFQSSYATRDRMIYAGSNDGFLHGIHAGEWNPAAVPPGHDRGTGAEVFGFMPYPARQNIKNLEVDSGSRDYYFVDGSPAAVDAWWPTLTNPMQTVKTPSEWHTVTVGGLRSGGNAYYAMDVTDPDAVNYPEVLWEFPAESAAASLKNTMGQTWSEPILTKIAVNVGGNDNDGEGFERWVAIFSGGYDPSGDPNDHLAYDPVATAGRAIYIVELETGNVIAEKKFNASAPVGDLQAEMLYAIPSTPAVFDLDSDGHVDVIYVGDLGGNVWKWVVEDLAIQNLDMTYDTTQPNWSFKRFFQAPIFDDAADTGEKFYKSFFFPPAATLRSGKLWLAFGSGERANLAFEGFDRVGDPEGENNRFYAMTDLDPLENYAIPYTTLMEVDLSDVSFDSTCADTTGFRGYYFIGEDGEKWVTNVDVFFYYVFVASYIPEEADDPCEAGGESFLYVFKIYCGEGYFTGAVGTPERSVDLGAGMPTDPRLTISPEDGGNRVIVTQQEGEISNFETPPGFGSGIGQFYWREFRP